MRKMEGGREREGERRKTEGVSEEKDREGGRRKTGK